MVAPLREQFQEYQYTIAEHWRKTLFQLLHEKSDR